MKYLVSLLMQHENSKGDCMLSCLFFVAVIVIFEAVLLTSGDIITIFAIIINTLYNSLKS